ncbi:MAG TPA: hypothetical protein VEL31_30105, partial [Ktedonobacteraceae bacterium]|nr:hypothetical protein [Ktedonobacteraceae bacterium]
MLRKLGSVALQHHILNLILQIRLLIAPVLITTMLSATVNAWYYIAGSIASLASIIPTALVFVGYTSGCLEPVWLARRMRLTLSLAFMAVVLANGVLQLGAKQALGL